jgi:hypothetical protein
MQQKRAAAAQGYAFLMMIRTLSRPGLTDIQALIHNSFLTRKLISHLDIMICTKAFF